jgi:hypothetical protein
MVLKVARKSVDGNVHAVFDRLCAVLHMYAYDCEEYDDDEPSIPHSSADKLQMQALSGAAAAHLQDHHVNRDLLFYSAELIDLSYDTFPASEQALVYTAERLVRCAAGCDIAAVEQ